MTEYEKLTLMLLANIAGGIGLQLSLATMQSDEERAGHKQHIIQFQQQMNEVLKAVSAVINRPTKQ